MEGGEEEEEDESSRGVGARSTVDDFGDEDGLKIVEFLTAFENQEPSVEEQLLSASRSDSQHRALVVEDGLAVPREEVKNKSTAEEEEEETREVEETAAPPSKRPRFGAAKVAPQEIDEYLGDHGSLLFRQNDESAAGAKNDEATAFFRRAKRRGREILGMVGQVVGGAFFKILHPRAMLHPEQKRILVKNPAQRISRRRHLEHAGFAHVRFDLKLRYEEEVSSWWEKPIDHEGDFGRAWFNARVALQIYSVFRFPYRLAFGPSLKGSVPLRHAVGGGSFVLREVADYYSDLLPDLFFLADIWVNMFSTFIPLDSDEVVTDAAEIRKRYARREKILKTSIPSLWLDMAAILPLHVAWNIPGVPELAIQIASVPRLARVVKLFEWFGEIEFDAHVDFRVVALCKFLLMMFGMAHWVGCLWWLFARLRNFDETTWVAKFNFAFNRHADDSTSRVSRYDVPGDSWRNYQHALYWGFNSMTAFGYSDVIPDNGPECVFATTLCLVQLMYNAYILGTLFRCALKRDEKSETYHKTMKYIENYADARRLPSELVARMKRYIQFVASRETASHEHVLQRMPPTLIAKIAKWQHRKLLESTKIFKGVPEQYLTLLLVKLRSRYLQRGDILFKYGDMAHELCFIQSGIIEEFEDDARRRPIRSVSEGILGELAFFMGISQPCCVSASTQTDVVLQSISSEDYEDLLASYAEGHSITTENIMAEFNLSRKDDDAAAADAKKKDTTTTTATTTANDPGASGGDDHRERVRLSLAATLKRRQDDALSVAVDAASEGDLETIRRIVQQGLDVNTGDYDGRTMLHLAAAEGNVKVARLLIDEGADVACFPEDDHELLTSQGFMSLSQLEACDNPLLLDFATYDPRTEHLLYEKPLHLVVNPPAENRKLVAFSLDGDPSISLCVTQDHDMFVRLGDADLFAKIPAADLLLLPPPPPTTTTTTDSNAVVTMLGYAREGVSFPSESPSSSSSSSSSKIDDLLQRLGLSTDQQRAAFLRLSGFWLFDCGGGDSLDNMDDDDVVSFKAHDDRSDHFLSENLKEVGVEHRRRRHKDATRRRRRRPDCSSSTYEVLDPRWSKKCFERDLLWDVVARLGKDDARHVLCRSVAAAASDDDNGKRRSFFSTRCPRLRDEIVQLALHAGYAASFEQREASWRVDLSDDRAFAEPKLRRGTLDIAPATSFSSIVGLRRRKRTWCARMPRGFVVVRRVATDASTGRVVRASRATIQGNCVDRWKQSPLHDAIQNDHQQVAQLLATHGADLVYDDPAGVLCNLVASEDFDGLKNNITFGAPPNAADYDGRTALHLAAFEGNSNFISWLIQSKANVNVMDRWGNTPLVDAVKNLHELPAKILFESGASLTHDYACSLLCDAALRGDAPFLQLLHECGTHVQDCDYDQRTALHLAAAEGQLVSVDFLIFAKADVTFEDRWGNSPIDDAIRCGHLEVARLLQGVGGKPKVSLTESQEANLKAVELTVVREQIRTKVDAQQKTRRLKPHIRDLVKLVQRELATADVQFARKIEKLEKLSANAMHKGGHEAMVASNNATPDEAFSMPELMLDDADNAARQAGKLQAESDCSDDDVAVGGGGGNYVPKGFAMRRFLGLDDLDKDDGKPPPPFTSVCGEDEDEFFASDGGGGDDDVVVGAAAATATATATAAGPSSSIKEQKPKSSSSSAAAAAGRRLSDADDEERRRRRFSEGSHCSGGGGLVVVVERDEEKCGPASRVRESLDTRPFAGKQEEEEAGLHPLVVLERNTIANSGRTGVDAKALAAQQSQKFTSFNQIILLFPTIEKGFELLRSRFEERKVKAISKDQMIPFLREDLEMADVTTKEVGDLFLTMEGEGAAGGGPAESLDFLQLVLAPTFPKLVERTSEDARREGREKIYCDSLKASFSIINAAFELLDTTGKGQISIQELKNAVGGELKFGDELVTLFARQLVIRRLDFMVSLLRWLSIIDEDELDTLDDAECEAAGVIRRTMAAGGGGPPESGEPKPSSNDKKNRGSSLVDAAAARGGTNGILQQRRANSSSGREDDIASRGLALVARRVGNAAAAAKTAAPASGGATTYGSSSSSSLANEFGLAVRFASMIARERRSVLAFVEEMWITLRFMMQPRKYRDVEVWLVSTCSKENVVYVFNDIDRDFSGTIDVDEFETFVDRTAKSAIPRYKVYEAFHKLSDDGVITLETFKEMWELCSKKLDGIFFLESSRLFSVARIMIIPGSFYDWALDMLQMVSAVYACATVPYDIAFYETRSLVMRTAVLLPMYLSDGVLWLSISRRFLTAYRNKHQKLVTSLAKIRKHYYKHDLVYDLASALPLDLVLWLAKRPPFRGILWSRLPRLLRVRDVYRYLRARRSELNEIRGELDWLCVTFALCLHLLACFWHYLTSNERSDNYQLRYRGGSAPYDGYGSFQSVAGEGTSAAAAAAASKDSSSGGGVETYFLSLYWVTAVLTAMGAGDLHPATGEERWFTIVLMVLNLSVLAYVLGIVSSLFMSADERLVKLREEIAASNAFIEARNLPKTLEDEIRSLSDFRASSSRLSSGGESDGNDVFRQLSKSLQIEVASHISRGLIEQSRSFKNTGTNFLDQLSTMLGEVTVLPETVLFRRSDQAKTLYLVSSGRVDLFEDDFESSSTFNNNNNNNANHDDATSQNLVSVLPGVAVAPIPFFFNVRHTCSARSYSVASSRLFALDRDSYRRLIKLYPDEEETISHNVLDDEEAGKSSGSSVGGSSVASGSSGKGGGGSSQASGNSSGPDDGASAAGSAVGSAAGGSSSQVIDGGGGGDDAIETIHKAIQKARSKKEKERVAARCAAASEGRLEDLKQIVEQSRTTSVDAGDYDLRTPMHLAASEGHKNVVLWLLENGASVNVRDRFDNTPMHDALRHRHDTIVGILREAGAQLELTEADTAGALCQAAFKNDLVEIRRLVENHADPNCFPVDDHQLLTNRGFLFLDDVLSYQGDDLLFASYDADSAQIIYERPIRVNASTSRTFEMVQFEDSRVFAGNDAPPPPQGTAPRWSLVATPDHDVFARVVVVAGEEDNHHHHQQTSGGGGGGGGLTKRKARELVMQPAADAAAAAAAKTVVTFLSRATRGVVVPEEEEAKALAAAAGRRNNDDFFVFATKFGMVDAPKKKTAFLELYGFWLANGLFEHGANRRRGVLKFYEKKRISDYEFVRSRLVALDVTCWHTFPSNEWCISDPAWTELFLVDDAGMGSRNSASRGAIKAAACGLESTQKQVYQDLREQLRASKSLSRVHIYDPTAPQFLREILGRDAYPRVVGRLVDPRVHYLEQVEQTITAQLAARGLLPPFHSSVPIAVGIAWCNIQLGAFDDDDDDKQLEERVGIIASSLWQPFRAEFNRVFETNFGGGGGGIHAEQELVFDLDAARAALGISSKTTTAVSRDPGSEDQRESSLHRSTENHLDTSSTNLFSVGKKSLFPWVLRLDQFECQSVIRGLFAAAGKEDVEAKLGENVLYIASSARFRDEVVHLCLHAGYSARVVSKSHGCWCWQVAYASELSQNEEPTVRAERDVKLVSYAGRVWCASMPHGFVIVRRVHRNPEDGVITTASVPTIQGNSGDYDHRTALHIAASEGHVDIIKYLLSRHADVNCVDRTGGTPLSDAIRHKRREAQKVLRDAGATVQHDDDAAAELCRLASEGELDELRVLVDNGLDVNLGDYDSRRALHLACCEERLAVVEYLLSRPEIDVNVVDRFGGTPLEDAIREGRHTVALLLQKHGALRAHHPDLKPKYDRIEQVRRERRAAHEKLEVAQEAEHTAVAALADTLRDLVNPLSSQNKQLQEQMQALILNAHPKNWRSRKAIEAGPKLNVEDCCSDVFLGAFRKFMKHEEHAEHMLDCYLACTTFEADPSFEAVEELLTNYVGKGAHREIVTAPKFVVPVQTALEKQGRARRPPPTLLNAIITELETKLGPYLQRFYRSSQFKEVINSKLGRIWRITSLCRIVGDSADDMITNVLANTKKIAAGDAITHIFGERNERVAQLNAAIDNHLDKLTSIKKFVIELSIGHKVLYERSQRRRRILGGVGGDA
ncbi:hypothetical protein CTAYLR_003139 [Chrysophaeum taylorii]|uniref:Calmodulin n=1 Tax=Chrysophaeum taylorii TaxID=2483200 RepID=A0AAD7UPY7_9STRA|nr:hypothetical protein CTAYLR_003139 [Chrysophaeum taylorii]